jgi:hypothetical protein
LNFEFCIVVSSYSAAVVFAAAFLNVENDDCAVRIAQIFLRRFLNQRGRHFAEIGFDLIDLFGSLSNSAKQANKSARPTPPNCCKVS